jgi:acetyl-CoA synthetase
MTQFPPWIWDIPEYFNIGAACTDAHLGTAVGERVAVIVDDDNRGVRQLSYADLAERTNRFGQLLRDLGIAAGERVLIRLANCIEYPTVFLGSMKRGAIPVPTSILLTGEEVVYLAQDSGATAVVTDRLTWNTLHSTLDQLRHVTHVLLTGTGEVGPSRRITVLDLEAALAGVSSWQDAHATRADDPAYLVYTSGTSGYPKGVLHAHRALLGRQPSSTYWFNFRPHGDRVLHSGKFNWTYVLGTGMMDPLYRGHTAIVHEGANDAALWPRLIARHAATTFIGVPTLYRQMLQKTSCGRADVPSLRHCMCAGEQLSEEVLTAWRARFGLDIYEGLGMTECSYYLCQTTGRPVRPGSCGFAQPGHDVKLLDPNTWREVATGEEGMLCIPKDDPGLMLGYWNQPEETAACFHGEFFLTGDYARRDADGYLWFLGRKDDLIKSFGYRVSPHEIERVLKEHPDVADAAATGEEIAPGKLLVVAYVIRRPESALGADDFIAYGRQRLASYKAPRIVYLVDDFPRTRNGKILRRALTPAQARARSSEKL